MLRTATFILTLTASAASAATFDGRGQLGCAEGTASQSIMQITPEGIAYQEYSCAFISENLNSDPYLDTRNLYCEENTGTEAGWNDSITLDLRHLPGAIATYTEGYEPDLIEACF